jgi:hypothetical protein
VKYLERGYIQSKYMAGGVKAWLKAGHKRAAASA